MTNDVTERLVEQPPGPPDHPYNVGWRNEPCRPPADLDATGKWEWRVKWRQGRRAAEEAQEPAEVWINHPDWRLLPDEEEGR